ncbi:HV307 protein, partial [Todus mexicanus]|nr:HV307 protein [Todus mexicanus]
VELVESGGGLQPPGGSLRLLCKASGFSLGSHGIFWMRQRPGGGLEALAGVGADGEAVYGGRGSGRVGVSRDEARGAVTLRVSGLRADDAA